MSILIKGHKMPDYCDECPVEYDGMCRLCSYADTEYHKRRDDCPLVAFDTDDVAPVVHGRWEVVYNSVGKQEGQCTHCGKNSGILITKKSYCPNCGAKMDESEDNDNA